MKGTVVNVITRGMRNAFRNRIRTFSIVVILGMSIGLALAMLIAYQAVGQKISSVKSSIGNRLSVSPAGVRGFDGGGNPLTQDDIAKLTTLPNVTSVDTSLNDRLTSADTSLQSAIDAGTLGRRNANNNGQGFAAQGPAPDADQTDGTGTDQTNVRRTFTPPVTVYGTTNPTKLSTNQGGGIFNLTSGKVFAADSTQNVAILGSTLATKNNLTVGSTFTAYGTPVTVIGIFDAGNTFANNQAIMPLVTVQTLSGQAGSITSATVTVDSLTNVDAVTTAAKNALGAKADVTNDAEQAKTTLSPLENIRTISLYSLLGSVAAGAVIILLTMIMIVRERRREIGVIKAIGASNMNIMLQFMTEAITLTILASIIGMIIGVFAGNPITHLLVNNASSSPATATVQRGRGPGRAIGGARNALSSVHGVVDWHIVVYGLGAAILIAIIGSALASFFIAKVRPAEVMRAE